MKKEREKDQKTEEPDYIAAHICNFENREGVLNSELCRCFHCLAIFEPSEIYEWIGSMDYPEKATAMCPKCEIDSVIGSASGYQIDKKFFKSMRKHWFGSEKKGEYL